MTRHFTVTHSLVAAVAPPAFSTVACWWRSPAGPQMRVAFGWRTARRRGTKATVSLRATRPHRSGSVRAHRASAGSLSAGARPRRHRRPLLAGTQLRRAGRRHRSLFVAGLATKRISLWPIDAATFRRCFASYLDHQALKSRLVFKFYYYY